MLTRFKHLVHNYVPRRWVNGVWNLASDVKDLPHRLSDDRPRPWRSVHNIGGGDFYLQAERLFDLLAARVPLNPDDHVLDIGCGAGRLAFPIGAFLNTNGRYVGFDIAPAGLAFARRHVKSDGRVHFVHADLANDEYRGGGSDPTRYPFPVDSGTVDVAVSTSVFTHIDALTAAHYIEEIGRVLRPGGRAMITAFLVDRSIKDRLAKQSTGLALQNIGDGSWAADPRHPERAIGFDQDMFDSWCARAGLILEGEIDRGWWSRSDREGEYQDVIVLMRA